MKICFLSTKDCACGIAEYAKNFVKEYENLGHEVKVFGNPEYFQVYWMDNASSFHTDKILAEIKEYSPQVLHVQYQGSLYEAKEFNRLISAVKDLGIKLVITIHDSSRGNHNLELFDAYIYHKEGILDSRKESGWNSFLVPFPVQEKQATILSYGMGRNDYDFIQRVCDELNIKFMKHDGRIHGWISEEDLYIKMKLADAIVLWYNTVSVVGASSAARTALSSYRPVITNNVGWFDDLDENHYYRADNEQELKETLDWILGLRYIKQISYRNIAKSIIEQVYGG